MTLYFSYTIVQKRQEWLKTQNQGWGGGGGGGFRLKPQMKVGFVWMWPYRILDARAQKECSWRVVHVLLQISWLAGALRVIIAALATSRASTQTTSVQFVKFVAAFFSLLLVWFAGDIKSERPSKDDEQHCRCVVWEEKTILQSLDVAFSAPGRKSPFRRVLHSCEGGRRLALLQGDSRVGRARIRKILALAEWELSSLTGLARYWMPYR